MSVDASCSNLDGKACNNSQCNNALNRHKNVYETDNNWSWDDCWFVCLIINIEVTLMCWSWEKGTGGGTWGNISRGGRQEWRGWEGRFPTWQEPGEITKNLPVLCGILHRKSTKRCHHKRRWVQDVWTTKLILGGTRRIHEGERGSNVVLGLKIYTLGIFFFWGGGKVDW